ncbi:MAG: hypothetical protein U1E67_21205 [Hyphomicrobiales bacterium]
MILSQHHACSAYVTDWLEAFGIAGDETSDAVDLALTDCEAVGLGIDEAADRTITNFLLSAVEPARLAA